MRVMRGRRALLAVTMSIAGTIAAGTGTAMAEEPAATPTGTAYQNNGEGYDLGCQWRGDTVGYGRSHVHVRPDGVEVCTSEGRFLIGGVQPIVWLGTDGTVSIATAYDEGSSGEGRVVEVRSEDGTTSVNQYDSAFSQHQRFEVTRAADGTVTVTDDKHANSEYGEDRCRGWVTAGPGGVSTGQASSTPSTTCGPMATALRLATGGGCQSVVIGWACLGSETGDLTATYVHLGYAAAGYYTRGDSQQVFFFAPYSGGLHSQSDSGSFWTVWAPLGGASQDADSESTTTSASTAAGGATQRSDATGCTIDLITVAGTNRVACPPGSEIPAVHLPVLPQP